MINPCLNAAVCKNEMAIYSPCILDNLRHPSILSCPICKMGLFALFAAQLTTGFVQV